MKEKFTAGPWCFYQNGDVGPVSREFNQSFGMMVPVCRVEKIDYPCQFEANGHLISAAPDLYCALKEIVSSSDGVSSSGVDLKKACEALAKARGE